MLPLTHSVRHLSTLFSHNRIPQFLPSVGNLLFISVLLSLEPLLRDKKFRRFEILLLILSVIKTGSQLMHIFEM